MADKPLNENIVEEFAEHYVQHHTCGNLQEVVYCMVEDGLTSPTRIRNYMIVMDYPVYLEKNHGRAMDATYQLGEKYEVSERLVQNVIYKWRKKFFKRRRKMRKK